MRKCFKQLIVYAIIEILSLNISYVNGDVFKLQQNIGEGESKSVSVNNEDEFRTFISGNQKSPPNNAKDPFTGDAANATQMLGYAVFFPEDSALPQQVYVAKKRKYVDRAPITDYKNVTSVEDFRNSTNFDHTERQLITKIISDYGINNGTKGSICVYTEWAPCKNNNNDNANYPCIKYYESLAKYLPNIQLHIYFQKLENISEASINEEYCTDSRVICELTKLTIPKEIECNLNINCKGNPKVNILLDNGLKQHIESTLNETTYRNVSIESKYRKSIINELNNILRKENLLNSPKKTQIFNKLYNPNQKFDNLQYECI